MHKFAGSKPKKIRPYLGLCLMAALVTQCQRVSQQAGMDSAMERVQLVSASSLSSTDIGGYAAFAQAKPLEFANYCLNRCRSNIHDYRCTFVKQETIDGKLFPRQAADVRFRTSPFSVDMTFVDNIRSCARALYVAGKWQDSDGQDLAWVIPGGAILRAFVPKIKQPIHGPRADKESRRTIDQFGFEESLELIVLYCEKAKAEGKLELRYLGPGTVGGRPTYVFERLLPYTGQEKPYPDRKLVYHIDQEYLVPTACYSYADDAGEHLLGSYVYTDVQLNPGYCDADFDPEAISF